MGYTGFKLTDDKKLYYRVFYLSDSESIDNVGNENIVDILYIECKPNKEISQAQINPLVSKHIKIFIEELKIIEKQKDPIFAHSRIFKFLLGIKKCSSKILD